jgi:DNA-binding transcriptional ArsR family regulator
MKRGPRESAVASVLFGKTRRRLLAWLFMHPDEAFYIRQLVRITGGSPGSVPVELSLLTSAGLLQRSSRGREVFYQANDKSPVFEELRGLILKTTSPASRR